MLRDVHIESLIKVVKPTSTKLVSLASSKSIEFALKLLATNNILSLPVESPTFVNKYICIISTFDIIAYLCKLNRQPLSPDTALSIDSVLSLENESESYRLLERDVKDTLESVI